MIVLPGPALVVIPVGLAILATEFVWARRLLERVREQVRRVAPQGSAGGGPRDGGGTALSSEKARRGAIRRAFPGGPCRSRGHFRPRTPEAPWSSKTTTSSTLA